MSIAGRRPLRTCEYTHRGDTPRYVAASSTLSSGSGRETPVVEDWRPFRLALVVMLATPFHPRTSNLGAVIGRPLAPFTRGARALRFTGTPAWWPAPTPSCRRQCAR